MTSTSKADLIQEAARLLRAGRLVAFPTETVYGLGAHAMDAAAVRRIYEAKGRPSTSPLIVHVANVAAARALAAEWPVSAQKLADAFNRRANRDNQQLTFKSVSITASAIEIVFNVKRG